MPDTTMTVREDAELKRLQKEKHQSIFKDGLEGKEITQSQQDTLLSAGEAMYGKEGVNALYFQKKKITANTQVTIDEFIQTLIRGLNTAILNGLPNTTLTEYEIEQIDQIMKYKI